MLIDYLLSLLFSAHLGSMLLLCFSPGLCRLQHDSNNDDSKRTQQSVTQIYPTVPLPLHAPFPLPLWQPRPSASLPPLPLLHALVLPLHPPSFVQPRLLLFSFAQPLLLPSSPPPQPPSFEPPHLPVVSSRPHRQQHVALQRLLLSLQPEWGIVVSSMVYCRCHAAQGQWRGVDACVCVMCAPLPQPHQPLLYLPSLSLRLLRPPGVPPPADSACVCIG